MDPGMDDAVSAPEAIVRARRYGRRALWLSAPGAAAVASGLVAGVFFHHAWGLRLLAGGFAWQLALLGGAVGWAAVRRTPAGASRERAATDRAARPGFVLIAAGLLGLAAVAAAFAFALPGEVVGPRWAAPLFLASLAALGIGGWAAHRLLRSAWDAADRPARREA